MTGGRFSGPATLTTVIVQDGSTSPPARSAVAHQRAPERYDVSVTSAGYEDVYRRTIATERIGQALRAAEKVPEKRQLSASPPIATSS